LERCAKAGDDRRRSWCRHIKLQVASCEDELWGRSNFHEATSVLRRLGQEKVHVPQNSPQQTPESPVSRPGAVRDAGIYDGYPGAAGMGKAQEVWPELSFRDHNQLGLQQSQIWPDRKGEVEREVKDILLAKAGSSQPLTGIRRSRNDDSMLRKSFCEFCRQAADRQNLADRYRVYPYGWLRGLGN
jgi:hypothetical protein